MRGPNLDNLDTQYAKDHKAYWKSHGQHIADIQEYQVLATSVPDSDMVNYSLWNQDDLVAYVTLHGHQVRNSWVDVQHRGQRIFSKMLWFFKTRLNINPLIIGDVHSRHMQEVIQGLSRFHKQWINMATGETRDFLPGNQDEFYSYTGPTGWQLMLENSGNFVDWPRFRGQDFVREAYDPYVQ